MYTLNSEQVEFVGGGNGAHYTVQAVARDFQNSVISAGNAVKDAADYASGFIKGFFIGAWNEA